MKTIGVIGAGTMGNGITHTFAQYGFYVHLIDLSEKVLQKSLDSIGLNLDRMVAKGSISMGDRQETLSRIKTFTSLEKGVIGIDVAIEAVPENKAAKTAIFKQLDQWCDAHTILATNTSSISISEIASVTKREDKVIGMHFMNPVPLMELVEIIKGPKTSKVVVESIVKLARALDKTPIEANDFPGFVANRILMPMLNEAIETLQNGVAGVKDIDTVMKLGMSHPMGPLQLADFIGLDVCLSIMTVLHKGFNNDKYKPCDLLAHMVATGNLGIKSGSGFYDYSNTRKAEKVLSQFA